MLIFRFCAVITLILLSGCTSSLKTGTGAAILSTKATELKKEGLASKEDKTSIDPDVLFMLLTAEIAGQRGQYGIALEGYMEAAKRVNDPRFAERAAMIAIYAKDAGKTDEAVSLWLKQDPGNLTARKIAALSSIKIADKQAAVDHFSALMKLDPAGFEKTVVELLAAVKNEDRTTFVYNVLDEVSARFSGRANIYFLQSILAAQMKNQSLAESKIQQALKLQPEWDKALVFQAQLSASSGDLSKAKRLLKTALAQHPDNEKIKKLYAQVLIKSEDYDAAGEIYQSLVIANPADIESQFALGLIHLQMEREDKAEEIFTKFVDQAEWQSQASFYLGKIEEQRGNKQGALVWYDKVTEEPWELEASFAAIVLLTRDKQFADAVTRLDALRTRYPDQKQRIVLMQADLYGQQKHYQQAFDVLTTALNDLGEQKDLLYTRALIADRLGRLDVLEADLQKILAKNPNNSEALNALGYSLLDKTRRYTDAEKYLQRALILQPNEPVIIDSYGWLQFKLGNMQKALGYLQQAYEKKQENEIAAHIVEVLWSLGKKEDAKKLFYSVIKKAPEDEYLLDVQRRVLKGDI